MAMKVIARLPVHAVRTEALTPDGTVQVLPYQIVVTVSLTAQDCMELPDDAPRFPEVLDTGNNHNFAIRRARFDRWADVAVIQRGKIQLGQTLIPLLAADLWIHPRAAGTLASQAAQLRLEEGIAVYPSVVQNPARLPILGLRALVRNDLRLVIDGEKREVVVSRR